MQIKDLTSLIANLEHYRVKGGKTFKEVNKLLHQEATTHSLEEAQKLLNKLAHK